MYRPETDSIVPRKIIPFPGVVLSESINVVPAKGQNIILARFGEELPKAINDFRPILQRDGLILLSWDKRITERGVLYTAYWVTSSGIHRYYASLPLTEERFPQAIPDHKSYAAEDGIEFYGEKDPEYIVHVAPELMMSSPERVKRRPEYIRKLKIMGIKVDFDYSFLLTAERKKTGAGGEPRSS